MADTNDESSGPLLWWPDEGNKLAPQAANFLAFQITPDGVILNAGIGSLPYFNLYEKDAVDAAFQALPHIEVSPVARILIPFNRWDPFVENVKAIGQILAEQETANPESPES